MLLPKRFRTNADYFLLHLVRLPSFPVVFGFFLLFFLSVRLSACLPAFVVEMDGMKCICTPRPTPHPQSLKTKTKPPPLTTPSPPPTINTTTTTTTIPPGLQARRRRDAGRVGGVGLRRAGGQVRQAHHRGQNGLPRLPRCVQRVFACCAWTCTQHLSPAKSVHSPPLSPISNKPPTNPFTYSRGRPPPPALVLGHPRERVQLPPHQLRLPPRPLPQERLLPPVRFLA